MDGDGGYDHRLNSFFGACPTLGVRSTTSQKAYAYDLLAFARFLAAAGKTVWEADRPSFERLQRRMHVRGPSRALMAEVPVLYVIFDVLWLDGTLLTGKPFVERRRLLEALGPKGPFWQVSHLLPEPPDEDMLAACRQVGLEGYLGKLASASYSVGKRSKA